MNIEPYKSLHSVILEVQAAAKPTKPAEKKLGGVVAAHKNQETWQTASGAWGAKNKDGVTDYFDSEDTAKAWIAGKSAPAGRIEKPGDTSRSVELDKDGFDQKPSTTGAPKPNAGKPTAAAEPNGRGTPATQAKATTANPKYQAQPQSSQTNAPPKALDAETAQLSNVGTKNPTTKMDGAFQKDAKATEKAAAKPDIRKANVVAKAIHQKELAGPKDDSESVFGDAQAERDFIDELNHAALSAMRGQTAYDFELCSEVFSHIGFCFDAKTKEKVTKGIPREEMPQFSSQVDPKNTESVAYKALMASKGYTTPDQVTPEDLKSEINMEKEYRKALEDSGYEVKEEEVDVTSLKPIQGQLKGEKVAGMYGTLAAAAADPTNYGKAASRLLEPIYVSDGYVIDGHHRWAAQCAMDIANGSGANTTMKTRTITKGGKPVPVEDMIKFSNGFQKSVGLMSQTRGGEAIKEKPKAKTEGYHMSKFGSGRISRITQSLHESVSVKLHEGGMKAALEDWIYALPDGAVEDLKKVMNLEAENDMTPAQQEAKIKQILKKHKVSKLMGRENQSVSAIMTSFNAYHDSLSEAAAKPKMKKPKIEGDAPDTFGVGARIGRGQNRSDSHGKQIASIASQVNRDAVAGNTIAKNEKTAADLVALANKKPEGTTFEIYGKKDGKETSVKIKKTRVMGSVVFMMGANQVELNVAGTGLQIINKKTRRMVLDRGNDMIWESADFTDVGMICITETQSKMPQKRKLSDWDLWKVDVKQRETMNKKTDAQAKK